MSEPQHSNSPPSNPNPEIEPDFGSSIQTAKTGYFSDYFPSRSCPRAIDTSEAATSCSVSCSSNELISTSKVVSTTKAIASICESFSSVAMIPLSAPLGISAESSQAFSDLGEMPSEQHEISEPQPINDDNVGNSDCIDLTELSDHEDPDELEILSVVRGTPHPRAKTKRSPHQAPLKAVPSSKNSSPARAAPAETAIASTSKGDPKDIPKSTGKPVLKLATKSGNSNAADSSRKDTNTNTSATTTTRYLERLSGGPSTKPKVVPAPRQRPTPVPRLLAKQPQLNAPVALRPDVDEQRVLDLLSQTFGHEAFRSAEQRNATYALLNG